MKQEDETSIYSTGKVDYVLFPDVYFKFVSELHKNHQDLLGAMVLAKVQLSDGSAIDFLNTFLGTRVDRMAPMEVGYAEFLDALNTRIKNKIAETRIAEVASQFKDASLFPHRSDPSKPIFSDEPTE